MARCFRLATTSECGGVPSTSLDKSPPVSHAAHTHGTRVDCSTTMGTTIALNFGVAVEAHDRLAALLLNMGDSNAGDSILELIGFRYRLPPRVNVFGGMKERVN